MEKTSKNHIEAVASRFLYIYVFNRYYNKDVKKHQQNLKAVQKKIQYHHLQNYKELKMKNKLIQL